MRFGSFPRTLAYTKTRASERARERARTHTGSTYTGKTADTETHTGTHAHAGARAHAFTQSHTQPQAHAMRAAGRRDASTEHVRAGRCRTARALNAAEMLFRCFDRQAERGRTGEGH